ncbi:MAG: hypothetical protein AABZ31_04750, partial [Bdellovibrionota bacterium]
MKLKYLIALSLVLGSVGYAEDREGRGEHRRELFEAMKACAEENNITVGPGSTPSEADRAVLDNCLVNEKKVVTQEELDKFKRRRGPRPEGE